MPAASSSIGIDDLHILDTIGEGTYGKVKLAYNPTNNQKYALKIIQLKYVEVQNDLKKEIAIHRNLNHQHVVKFYGYVQKETALCMVLEYASGGELFDRIEPDVGIHTDLAHFYFRQLISGVEYLHSRGIAHRDIKPENLLLDECNNIKICDFGLSTIFRHMGQTRRLDRRCGTPPYIAPEVFAGIPHGAEPADVWSCGVVLVTMLAGCLPWDEPSMECPEFRQWMEAPGKASPWEKMPLKPLDLLKKILEVDPAKRATIEEIKKHPWFQMETMLTRQASNKGMLNLSLDRYMELLNINNSPPRARARVDTEGNSVKSYGYGEDRDSKDPIGEAAVFCSQPDPVQREETAALGVGKGLSFSQPTYSEDLLISQDLTSQAVSQATSLYNLAHRMTRFSTRMERSTILSHITSVLDKMSCRCQVDTMEFTVKAAAIDRRKAALKFTVRIYETTPGCHLVDFRRAKGDGLEFKRYFKEVKHKLKDHVTWEASSASTYFGPMVNACGSQQKAMA